MFLDDDYVPPPEFAADFAAGRQAEIDRFNSPEEQARAKQWGEELGLAIANNLKKMIQ